ncbi:MAG TPA: hypothetical protein VFJ64_10825 [Solirubrobacterales bacterium]|nr:hypothetical protein [Solirubrobacterales bacterium]
MTCVKCTEEIARGERVSVNGYPYHVVTCFIAAVRSRQFEREDLEVELDPEMPPMVAYRAGKQFTAAIVASRRKAKAPAARGAA